MNAILLLLPIALLLGGLFLTLFLIAASQGQFDDLEDAPRRMLQDDTPLPNPTPPPSK